MTNRELELKACPFCGETPEIKKHFREAMWCMTHRCKVIGPISFDWASAPEIVAEAWNRRAEPAQADTVPMPQNADQAQMMANVGVKWLQDNAPERLKTAQAEPVAWKEFDYRNPPEEGCYWLRLESYEWDGDVDDCGSPIGEPTGKTTSRVLLGNVEFAYAGQRDGVMHPLAYTVDRALGRDMADDELITHYAEIVMPTAPQQEQK